MVDVVRGDDRDRVDAVGARGFLGRHFLEARIGPLRRDPQLGGGCFGAFRIGAERARDQLVAVVEARGDAVHGADERALAAADHAEAQPAPEPALALAFDGHRLLPQPIPSMRRFAASSAPWPMKSSNEVSVTRMMCAAMNSAPSRAPSSGCFRQHSHSSTAQLP